MWGKASEVLPQRHALTDVLFLLCGVQLPIGGALLFRHLRRRGMSCGDGPATKVLDRAGYLLTCCGLGRRGQFGNGVVVLVGRGLLPLDGVVHVVLLL